jgi:hypothetical protein
MNHDAAEIGTTAPIGATLQRDSPCDIVLWEEALTIRDTSYRVEARSVVVLYAPAV